MALLFRVVQSLHRMFHRMDNQRNWQYKACLRVPLCIRLRSAKYRKRSPLRLLKQRQFSFLLHLRVYPILFSSSFRKNSFYLEFKLSSLKTARSGEVTLLLFDLFVSEFYIARYIVNFNPPCAVSSDNCNYERCTYYYCYDTNP